MILLYIFVLMIACGSLSFISDRLSPKQSNILVAAIIVLMVVISGTRPGSYVSDYAVYEDIFYNFDGLKARLTFEPTFLWLCEKFYYMNGTIRWVIWVYAIIAIPLKVYSLYKMSNPEVFFLAIPIYLGNFFQLHDCEQMRLAAALALTMYSFLLRLEGKKWLWIIFWLIAITFHHTAAALILPLLITPKKAMGYYWRIGMIVAVAIGIVFWIIKVSPVTVLPIPYIEAKMALYEIAISNGEHPDIQVIHPTVLLRMITFLYTIYFYDTIYEHLKCLNLVLVCEAIGLFCWFGLSTTSVFAVRMSELFEVTEIILFASVFYTIKPYWLGKIYPCMFALYLFLYGCKVNQFGFL